jgi:hypothetical protein
VFFILLASLGLLAPDCTTQSWETESCLSAFHGSVGVAVIRRDTIVVATDSRTRTDGFLNPDTACKMTIVGDVAFAAAGLLKGNDSTIAITDYARSVLESDERIGEKTNAFQTGASRLVTSWVDIPENRDSLASSTVFRNEHSVHAMFCFFSRGRPVVVKYDFVPWLEGNRFKIRGAYDAGARKPGEIIFIGESENAQSLLSTDSVFAETISALSAVRAAELLIRKQMEFTPDLVGGPVDVAVVTPTTAHWIQKKQNCY